MSSLIETLFGSGKELDALQMCTRAIAVFLYCLFLLRLSGRRAMAIGAPVDNVIGILLGAILSRVVTGASPFWPTIAAGGMIAVLYRVFTICSYYSKTFGSLVKGKMKIVYDKGEFIQKNMAYCGVTKDDLMLNVRLTCQQEDLRGIQKILVERNGKISIVKNG